MPNPDQQISPFFPGFAAAENLRCQALSLLGKEQIDEALLLHPAAVWVVVTGHLKTSQPGLNHSRHRLNAVRDRPGTFLVVPGQKLL